MTTYLTFNDSRILPLFTVCFFPFFLKLCDESDYEEREHSRETADELFLVLLWA